MIRRKQLSVGTIVLALLVGLALLAVPACKNEAQGPDANSDPGKGPAPTVKGGGTGGPPTPAPAGNLVDIKLELPKPRFSGTPKNIPPGTRVKITKGPFKPRPPFKVPKGAESNVALKKPVTSSDMEPVIGTLDLITDGNKEASEDAYVELGPGVQWVQVDLEKTYKIYCVIVWHEHKDARVYHDVVVQIADDKDFITNVRTLYSNDHDNSAGQGIGQAWEFYDTFEGHLVDDSAVKDSKARYIRLFSNGSTADDLNRYTEVAVYGIPAE